MTLVLLLRILFFLPTAIKTIRAIIALLPQFKNNDLAGDLALIVEILQLILGLIPFDKTMAKSSLSDLRDTMESKGDLNALKDKVVERKKQCEGNFCPSDLK